MFELLFKYPAAMFERGEFVFGRPWPPWLLIALAATATCYAGWVAWRARVRFASIARAGLLSVLSSLAIATILLMLWQPALSVSSLRPRQNVVAVVMDNSRSMSAKDGDSTRVEQARRLLNSGLLAGLERQYPVKIYAAGADAIRTDSVDSLQGEETVTRLGDALSAVAAETATLPIGAVILLSDGADNSGGFDRRALASLRQARIPVHTIGFGPEQLANDVEIVSIDGPSRALPGSRVTLTARLRQAGFDKRQAKLTAFVNGKAAAVRQVELPAEGEVGSEQISVTANDKGALNVELKLEPQAGEFSSANNSQTTLVQIEDRSPRILYFEGEPRWEYKFILRAAETDKQVQLASLLRTTQNKLYRQGIASPQELVNGFPSTVEELFAYDALIFGSVEAGAFTPAQLSLIRAFADRRGGGVLFLGGRSALADGGWQNTVVADILPVSLIARGTSFVRAPVKAEAARRGLDHDITKLEESLEQNAARWRKMPPLADSQRVGSAKPAALVLLDALAPSGRFPLLSIQQFGRGRVAVLATGGTWKWQMLQDSRDMTHETFWRQTMRWLVAEAHGRVAGRVSSPVLNDSASLRLEADIFDTSYMPQPGAVVEAVITGGSGAPIMASLQPDPDRPGRFSADVSVPAAGSYAAQITARQGDSVVARDELLFQRRDGVAEAFHPEQNRPLLESLATQTGGKYWKPSDAAGLVEEIQFSEGGLSVRELHDLWDMPVLFLFLISLKSAEWILRRKWGAV